MDATTRTGYFSHRKKFERLTDEIRNGYFTELKNNGIEPTDEHFNEVRSVVLGALSDVGIKKSREQLKLEAEGRITGKTYELAILRRDKKGDVIAHTCYNRNVVVYFSHADIPKLLKELRELKTIPVKTEDIKIGRADDWTRTLVVDPEAKELAKAMRERIFGPVEVIK